MSKLKDAVVHNRNKDPVWKSSDLASMPPLSNIFEIILVDQNDKRYVYRLFKNETETSSDQPGETAYESLSIDLDDIKDIFIKLTDDQRKIVMHVYYMYKNKLKIKKQDESGETVEHNPRIILQGPAGSGKSTIISLIEKLITWEENKTSDSPQNLKVLKCAFTGKAASNIDGLTLHHTFSIPIYKPARTLSAKRLAAKQTLLQDCIFFICDEISMVGEKTMTSVNKRLQQIFGNNELYGDRFVLLVGDLYQIGPFNQIPVSRNSIFWTCCEFYELTEIIRQHDENFINALNNFRDSRMTEADIQLLKSRQVQPQDVPDSVTHLFYLNKYVDERNNEQLDKSNAEEVTVNVIDSDEWQPSNLRVKIGIRYMITYNIDVGDGLANGTTGVVKAFDTDGNDDVIVIWMEFRSNVTGRKTRADYLRKHNVIRNENWVPIQRSKMIVKLKNNPQSTQTIGNMFPLRAAEAITVHKSQGQTYDGYVCVNITDDPYDRLRTDKSLQYVALTRVKRLEDLYIVGPLEFSTKNSKRFTGNENELNRLRNERKLKLAYETFESKTGDVIVYLNTQFTFYKHYQFIASDKWYSNASLLIFSETNTVASDNINIPNFEIAYRSDEQTALRSGRGIICYKEHNKTVEVVSSMSDDENNIYLTVLLYEKYLYIITGVKDDLTNDKFKDAINLFVSKYIKDGKCVFFIGAVNSDPDITFLTDFLNDLGFKIEPTSEIQGIDGNTQCDIVLTRNINIPKECIGSYEYIPSSHKPLYVELSPTCKVGKSNTQVMDDLSTAMELF